MKLRLIARSINSMDINIRTTFRRFKTIPDRPIRKRRRERVRYLVRSKSMCGRVEGRA
jgi:hypothetical protein